MRLGAPKPLPWPEGRDSWTDAEPGSGDSQTVLVTTRFRCSADSLLRDEPLAGTAPTEAAWLLIEDPGPWGSRALTESRLPAVVRTRLLELAGVRVQLIRRYGGGERPGARVFAATAGEAGFRLESALLEDTTEVLGLDLAGLAAGGFAGLPAYEGPLWLVCTNGRRDVCCAESGRPVAAALTRRWPESTWETTHLGGHRFAATLLALPSGLVLGRLDPDSALAACVAVERGEVPLDVCRGRAGAAPGAQVAELHVRELLGLRGSAGVEVLRTDPGNRVTVRAGGADYVVHVQEQPGDARRLSCADLTAKPTGRFTVTEVVRLH